MDKYFGAALIVGVCLSWANDVIAEDYPAEWGFDDGLIWHCTGLINGVTYCENEHSTLRRQCKEGNGLECTDPVLICIGDTCPVKI